MLNDRINDWPAFWIRLVIGMLVGAVLGFAIRYRYYPSFSVVPLIACIAGGAIVVAVYAVLKG
jgi:uncharacterized membrane protein YeaQ/YmgE (transglycosylase-associated protein family)